MTCSKLRILGMAACLTAFAGCDDDDVITPDAAVDSGIDAPVIKDGPAAETGGDTGGDAPKMVSALYTRLGGAAGINTVNTAFVGRVLADPKINGYFLNSNIDGGKLLNCLNLQVGAATGGLEVYPSAGCRNMKETHLGMGVSKKDFDDLVKHFVDTLKAANVADADILAIGGVLGSTETDIVEDLASNKTVYQRVGRKPAVAAVIEKFVGRVAGDIKISGFFSADGLPRLKTCLTRQVCSIDGPCKYGSEVDAAPGEPGVSKANPCKDMLTSHRGLTNPRGGAAGAKTIGLDDFNILVDHLKVTLTTDFNVPAAEQTAILDVLGGMCGDIVAGPGCGPTAYGLTTDSKLVSFDITAPETTTAGAPITGLVGTEAIIAITYRPSATAGASKLYALTNNSRLYELNPSTGIVTSVPAPAVPPAIPPVVPAPFTPALNGTFFGFDFNPQVDRIRVTSNLGQNLRLHPDTGVVVMGMADTMLNPGVGKPASNVVAVAYTNSGLPVPAVKTTLFGIDATSDKLIRIGGVDGAPQPGGAETSPNAGVVSEIGALGVNTMSNVGFDIQPGTNRAYAALEVTANKTTVYRINLATGAASLVGELNAAAALRSIALVP